MQNQIKEKPETNAEETNTYVNQTLLNCNGLM